MTDEAKVAVVAGASPGLGSALCNALSARGFSVLAVGRAPAVLAVADSITGVTSMECDLTKATEVDAVFTEIERDVGIPSVVIYNAHRLELHPSEETPLSMFEEVWRVNCFGAFVVSKRALPAMVRRGEGTVIFTGATASVRGGKRSAAFASSKFALRGLAQSLAREFGPSGVHVAHVVLDGLMWSERTRQRFSALEATCMNPDEAALAFLSLADQRPSAWTHEIDLRPSKETF